MSPTERPPRHSADRPADSGTVIAVALVGAAAVLTAAIAIPVLLPLAAGGDGSGSRPFAAGEPTLDEVRVYEELSAEHLDGRIDYPQAPPAGGAHHPRWLECGIYEEVVPDELAVHSLEHGTVWITYDPGLPHEDILVLQEALPSDGIMSPYPAQTGPVVVTVWGRQLALAGATVI